MAQGRTSGQSGMPHRRRVGAVGLIALSAVVVVGCQRPGTAVTAVGTNTAAPSLSERLDPCAPGQGASTGTSTGFCAQAGVAAAAQALGAQMAEAAATVSPEGQTIFVEGQQQFLRAARVQCGITEPGAGPSSMAQAECLQRTLSDRAQSARESVETRGPFRFQAVEQIEAKPSAQIASIAEMGADAPPALTSSIRFPRIDSPRNAQTEAFNAAVRQSPQFALDEGVEEIVNYEIFFAGDQVISVRFNSRLEDPVSGRADENMKAVTIVMATGQPLKVEDVFRPGTGWERFLFSRAIAALRPQVQERISGAQPEVASVRDVVVKPQTWLINERGLTLLFSPLNVGLPGTGDAYTVEIPWGALRSYLNPNAPAPIRAPG